MQAELECDVSSVPAKFRTIGRNRKNTHIGGVCRRRNNVIIGTDRELATFRPTPYCSQKGDCLVSLLETETITTIPSRHRARRGPTISNQIGSVRVDINSMLNRIKYKLQPNNLLFENNRAWGGKSPTPGLYQL